MRKEKRNEKEPPSWRKVHWHGMLEADQRERLVGFLALLAARCVVQLSWDVYGILVKFLNPAALCLDFTKCLPFSDRGPLVWKFAAGAVVILSISMREENVENAKLGSAQRRNFALLLIGRKSSILLTFPAQTVQDQNKSITLCEPSKEVVHFVHRDFKSMHRASEKFTSHGTQTRCNVSDQLSPFVFVMFEYATKLDHIVSLFGIWMSDTTRGW